MWQPAPELLYEPRRFLVRLFHDLLTTSCEGTCRVRKRWARFLPSFPSPPRFWREVDPLDEEPWHPPRPQRSAFPHPGQNRNPTRNPKTSPYRKIACSGPGMDSIDLVSKVLVLVVKNTSKSFRKECMLVQVHCNPPRDSWPE